MREKQTYELTGDFKEQLEAKPWQFNNSDVICDKNSDQLSNTSPA